MIGSLFCVTLYTYWTHIYFTYSMLLLQQVTNTFGINVFGVSILFTKSNYLTIFSHLFKISTNAKRRSVGKAVEKIRIALIHLVVLTVSTRRVHHQGEILIFILKKIKPEIYIAIPFYTVHSVHSRIANCHVPRDSSSILTNVSVSSELYI